MSNLTQTEKVARIVSLDPIPGHALVIYKSVGNGKVFFTELSPEQQFKEERTSWWKRFTSDPPSYIAYAVNLNEHLKTSFSERVGLHTQTKYFDLLLTVEYHVSLPRRVAERYEDDPLTLLQNEIFNLVKNVLSAMEFDAIKHRFALVAEETLDCTRAEIDGRAQKLGFKIEAIRLERQLLEWDTKVEALVEETKVGQEMREIKHQDTLHQTSLEYEQEEKKLQHEGRLHTQKLEQKRALMGVENVLRQNERRNKAMDGLTDAGIDAVKIVASEMKSPKQIEDGFNVLQRIAMRQDSEGGVATDTKAVGAAPISGYLGAQSSGTDALGKVIDLLYRTYQEVGGVDYSLAERNRLLSVLFHLAAESMLCDEANNAKIQEYQEQLKDVVEGLSHWPPELERFVRDNYRSLKDRLKAGREGGSSA